MINNSINFKGVPVAKIMPKNGCKKGGITIYELNSSDRPYLKKLSNNLNLKALNPNEKSYKEYSEWRNIIEGGILRAGHMPTYLAVSDKRPCGIMSCNIFAKGVNFLSILATWPMLPDKKVKYAGSSLVVKLIKDSIKAGSTQIDVAPATCAPNGKNCKTFYQQIGFKKDLNDDIYMALKDSDFHSALERFKTKFDYKTLENRPNYDLNSILKPNRKSFLGEESLFDTIKRLFTK